MENGMCDRKKERRRIDDVDRISALPEPILQLIMSFLPFNRLVQISVLSKAWLQAWRTFPVLEIDEIKSRPNKWETIGNSRTYWEKLLTFRSHDALNLANQCIRYAIANNVKELELEHMHPLDRWYSLPQMVLCSKSVNVLKLQGYKLESLPLGNDLNLSLRKLSLSNVFHKYSKVLNLRSRDCEHLNFTVSLSHPFNFAIAKVMDFLLWISPHAETVCVDYEDKKKFYFQFTYNQQPVYEGKIAECCKSLPISCWEHCIKEVEIDVNSTYFKMNMNTHEIHRISKVERFVFYEGENISEKIDSLAESGVSHFEEIY
ncbi:F-box/LRR-repeat protein [Citrus sinensis]|nr:F-box/LRR-repeat protein [Citrus sinensis]